MRLRDRVFYLLGLRQGIWEFGLPLWVRGDGVKRVLAEPATDLSVNLRPVLVLPFWIVTPEFCTLLAQSFVEVLTREPL